MSDRILLLSTDPGDMQFVSSLSKTCRIPVSNTWDSPTGKSDAGAQGELSVFCTVDQAEGIPGTCDNIHLLSAPFRTETLNKFLIDRGVSGLIFRGQHGSEECAGVYSRIFNSSGPGRLGLAEFLVPEPRIVETNLTEASQRHQMLDNLETFLKENGCQRRIMPVVINAADELVMNGIFDAPTTPDGDMKHRLTPRTDNFTLSGRDQITFSMGFNADYLGVSVLDQHGSLNLKKVLRHVVNCLKPVQYTVDDRSMGAGLGLGMTLHSGASLIFSVEPGVRTEVTAIFRRSANLPVYRNQFQFVVTRQLGVSRP